MGTDRPYRIGFVSWPLIIGGMLTIYGTMKILGSPAFDQTLSVLPYSLMTAQIILLGSSAVFIVSGMCMYERQGWARYIYLITAIPFYIQRFLLVKAIHDAGTIQLKPGLAVVPPHLGLADLALIAQAVFYLFSLWALFSWRSRRYYHPPMYVDE